LTIAKAAQRTALTIVSVFAMAGDAKKFSEMEFVKTTETKLSRADRPVELVSV